MKLLLSALLMVMFFSACQQKNYIYIVRHAEKSDWPSADVYLTQGGRQRANALKGLMQHKNLSYIFSTRYNRTRETVTPISSESGVPITFYGNDTLARFVKNVMKLKKNLLIVGHSNTVLTILDSMHAAHSIKNIPDNDYDNLFIVMKKKGKIVSVKETTYGQASPVSGAKNSSTGTMK